MLKFKLSQNLYLFSITQWHCFTYLRTNVVTIVHVIYANLKFVHYQYAKVAQPGDNCK